MMRASTNTIPAKRSRPATFEFEALEGLPCGCVAVAYRSRLWDVTLAVSYTHLTLPTKRIV